MKKCEFCFREFSIKGLNGHKFQCEHNPNKKIKRHSNQYIKSKENNTEYTLKDNTRKLMAENAKSIIWDKEKKKSHSNIMKKVVKENPDSYSRNNVCGRVKIIEYKPGIKLKGKWEVSVAEWLDSQNISWENEANPQPYYWKDDWKLYFPDFYLPEYNCYIEVKGYRTDRDTAKWDYFKGNLLIFEKESIDKLCDFNIEYALRKYKWPLD